MGTIKSFRLKAVLENVPRAIECVSESARSAGFDDHALHGIQVAVDEACANVIQHGYTQDKPGDMEITCQVDEAGLTIQVRDWGKSFDPDTVPQPDICAPLDERCLGGLGLFLMRQYMDEVHFRFHPQEGNELTMIKRCQVGEECRRSSS